MDNLHITSHRHHRIHCFICVRLHQFQLKCMYASWHASFAHQIIEFIDIGIVHIRMHFIIIRSIILNPLSGRNIIRLFYVVNSYLHVKILKTLTNYNYLYVCSVQFSYMRVYKIFVGHVNMRYIYVHQNVMALYS